MLGQSDQRKVDLYLIGMPISIPETPLTQDSDHKVVVKIS